MLEKPELQLFEVRGLPKYGSYPKFDWGYVHGRTDADYQVKPQPHSFIDSGSGAHLQRGAGAYKYLLALHPTQARRLAENTWPRIEIFQVDCVNPYESKEPCFGSVEQKSGHRLESIYKRYQKCNSIDDMKQLCRELTEEEEDLERKKLIHQNQHEARWERWGNVWTVAILIGIPLMLALPAWIFGFTYIFEDVIVATGMALFLGFWAGLYVSWFPGRYAIWHKFRYTGDCNSMLDPWTGTERFITKASRCLMENIADDLSRHREQQ